MTAKQLIARWEERDRWYAVRSFQGIKAPLSEREVAAVRLGRALEIEALPVTQREGAYAELARWAPPEVMV